MGIREIEKIFLNSPVARINWASQMVILDGSLPLGIGYWYMKQSVEMGWSSNVLKIQIETNLYSRQISNNKVNNFTATLPAPQSDLAHFKQVTGDVLNQLFFYVPFVRLFLRSSQIKDVRVFQQVIGKVALWCWKKRR